MAAVRTAPAAGAPRGAAGFVLRPPQLLFDGVDPAATPAHLGAGWLVVTEALPGTTAQEPFAGEAGTLLLAMLRALHLHRHPRVHLAALERVAHGEGAEEPAAALGAHLAALQPAMVLLMGRAAAQTVLGSSEPLGRLRAQVHLRGGVPHVVTYDPPYLLRAQADKARAWADLVLALRVLRGDGA
ncbi:uracil-DNA glycosylase family protein [Ramlibacter sp. H39-3-26]|nr:uracil-DNA glycosylase family protein [Ramlibacter sp. H39-3-26]MDF1485997.1 uracil-DNA glycosylase family protein [Ramlibacter sp. H39-3-26]